MASFSRIFLVLALVAMLCAGAFAERQLLKSSGEGKGVKAGSGKSGKSGKMSKASLWKACKAFPGCKTCDESDDEGVFCAVYKCDVDEGYGLLPKGYKVGKSGKKSTKSAKSGKGVKYGHKCVLCEDYELESVEGLCVEFI